MQFIRKKAGTRFNIGRDALLSDFMELLVEIMSSLWNLLVISITFFLNPCQIYEMLNNLKD